MNSNKTKCVSAGNQSCAAPQQIYIPETLPVVPHKRFYIAKLRVKKFCDYICTVRSFYVAAPRKKGRKSPCVKSGT